MPYRIRAGVPRDAAALHALERRCFADAWSEASFREALTSAWSFVLVADAADGVLGYLIGREVGGAGEVLNVAVAPEARRRRIARGLLESGIARFATRGAEEVFLEVRESNSAAQLLYADFGFRVVGQRAGYYRQPPEDALIYRLPLGGRV